MHESIKLSILVPIYNVEQYLRRGIDSLINQTYRNIEIILVNDGSTDGSGLICDEYMEKDERICVIHKANGGIVSALNAGIEIVTGDYTIGFDPDDWIEKDAYEMVVERIEECHADVISFGMIKDYPSFSESYPNFLEEGLYTKEEFWRLFRKAVCENRFFIQPMDMSRVNKAIKTELFRKHQLNVNQKLKKNVDDALILPVLMDMSGIYVDSRCWYHYCVRKSSILWETTKGDEDRFILLSNHMLDAYGKYGSDVLGIETFLLYKIVHHMMLDIPEKLLEEQKCLIYPEIKRDSRIVIYGKGVFANRLIRRMKEFGFSIIIDNVDSDDFFRLQNVGYYDYVVIAVFNARIIESVLDLLDRQHVEKNKILTIDKSNITMGILPEGIKNKYKKCFYYKGAKEEPK